MKNMKKMLLVVIVMSAVSLQGYGYEGGYTGNNQVVSYENSPVFFQNQQAQEWYGELHPMQRSFIDDFYNWPFGLQVSFHLTPIGVNRYGLPNDNEIPFIENYPGSFIENLYGRIRMDFSTLPVLIALTEHIKSTPNP